MHRLAPRREHFDLLIVSHSASEVGDASVIVIDESRHVTGDRDLDNALLHNRVELSGHVVAILSMIAGENEGADWHWLVLLSSGQFAYITGWCDHTGWDCESNCEAFEADTLRETLRLVPEAYRNDVLAGLDRTRSSLEGARLAAFDELLGGAGQ